MKEPPKVPVTERVTAKAPESPRPTQTLFFPQK